MRCAPTSTVASNSHTSSSGSLLTPPRLTVRNPFAGRGNKPYYESDHVLNIAYNTLCGGQRLEDIEARRCDAVFLDGLGAESLPDPTTAGDFCRRFSPEAVLALQEAVNRARLKVWRQIG